MAQPEQPCQMLFVYVKLTVGDLQIEVPCRHHTPKLFRLNKGHNKSKLHQFELATLAQNCSLSRHTNRLAVHTTAQHEVTTSGIPCLLLHVLLRAEMCNSTVRASCLACYSCSNEQLFSCAATISLLVGICRSDTSALLLQAHSSGAPWHFAHHHLCGCMLCGQFLPGGIRSVVFHAVMLKKYANDTSMHGSLVSCCPVVVMNPHATPLASSRRTMNVISLQMT